MAAMTFSQKNRLAHEMGAFYENGRWYFPSPALKEEFLRKSGGVEWTAEERAKADKALEHYRKVLREVPMEPEGK